jgi:hypothetical protein
MYLKVCFVLSMCNIFIGSAKEDIVCQQLDGHHNHWGEEKNYNEQRRDSLPASSLVHNSSVSIISQRVDRGVIDIPGAQRVVSDDSLNNETTVNIATNVDVNAKCCNSNCCDDDKDNKVWCCC